VTRIDVLGYLASGLVLGTFCMRTLVPLRVTAICSNVAFILYGFLAGIEPVLLLHAALLPMNIWRLAEMLVVEGARKTTWRRMGTLVRLIPNRGKGVSA